jgi:hypothetical protein
VPNVEIPSPLKIELQENWNMQKLPVDAEYHLYQV